ncbi:MAG TPA: 16S rRNA (guanine(966)-N(2))-methyltransferase RsmD [Kiritimatiellia bacterium]|nr:16S rRNA (guanine(966)-N(2))-methyltransferase RsmD [Kiritimatiellia bacterium]
MRITGGELGGRRLTVPAGVRPTQDKVRQAIFSALGERVVGATVLDLFAGTGALGLEAASRGAASVCWVEANSRTAALLRATAQALCPDVGRVVQADALTWLKRAAGTAAFTLIFADPPYDQAGEQRWLEKTLPLLESGSIVTPRGVLVFEMSAAEAPVSRPGWNLAWNRTYGDTRVCMYQHETGAAS